MAKDNKNNLKNLGNLKNFSPISKSMKDKKIVVEVIEAREPSIEFLRDMIDDADDKFAEWLKDWSAHTMEDRYHWMKQQLIDLTMVNNKLKYKEDV
jgi:hypothetical protein|tara:strand:- start:2707 stop:2994 length:288 start_codon:yes stop_codon:yes gene_type:complete